MKTNLLLGIYRTMVLSRRFDEHCMGLISQGRVLPHYHSGAGQEALMVASVAPMRVQDQMIYTHRGYGHLLAKGVTLKEIVLDMLMKKGGTNEGFGGVMHVTRPDLGVPGREGVFGTRFGIGVGLALGAQIRETNQVVVVFYGEAAGSRGQLYESLNMAVLWDLPVIFIAENNGWSFSSRTEWLFPNGRMSQVWRGFDIPVSVIDGNDPEVVYGAVSAALDRARKGKGPSVIEGVTYRVDPHIWFDDAEYQPKEEIAAWRDKDPIELARQRLLEAALAPEDLDAIDEWARHEVMEAFVFADSAPLADWSGQIGQNGVAETSEV